MPVGDFPNHTGKGDWASLIPARLHRHRRPAPRKASLASQHGVAITGRSGSRQRPGYVTQEIIGVRLDYNEMTHTSSRIIAAHRASVESVKLCMGMRLGNVRYSA